MVSSQSLRQWRAFGWNENPAPFKQGSHLTCIHGRYYLSCPKCKTELKRGTDTGKSDQSRSFLDVLDDLDSELSVINTKVDQPTRPKDMKETSSESERKRSEE